MLGLCKAFGLKKFCDSHPAANPQFNDYVAKWGKSYKTKEEFQFRQEIFDRKDKEDKVINSDTANTFKVGHNQFSTWTDAEYDKLLGYKPAKGSRKTVEISSEPLSNLPETVDWRTSNIVHPIKNQGSCGSCWAFAACSEIESHHAQKNGVMLTLSEQEMVDCDTNCYGCNGGW